MHKNDFIVFVCALGCLYSAGCAAEQAEMPQSLEYYGLKFVLVPQGSRMIGTNNSRARPHERPACEFRLDYTLYMSTTEVPVWLYESVMRDGGIKGSGTFSAEQAGFMSNERLRNN